MFLSVSACLGAEKVFSVWFSIFLYLCVNLWLLVLVPLVLGVGSRFLCMICILKLVRLFRCFGRRIGFCSIWGIIFFVVGLFGFPFLFSSGS